MNKLNSKKILLIICGGIAAYKSLEIIRIFKKKGALVKTIMTKSFFIKYLYYILLQFDHTQRKNIVLGCKKKGRSVARSP